MKHKKFVTVFLCMFVCTIICSYVVWRIFWYEKKITYEIPEEIDASMYEEVEFMLPVKAFLKRCAASNNLSYVRSLFVNQWISSNQKDLASLIVYAQGSLNYEEMKKAFLNGIAKEKGKTEAAKFITNAIDIIDKDQKLIDHVTKSLQQGYPQKIQKLKTELMQTDKDSKEFKRLKTEYKKELENWINQKHGSLLDEIIAQL